MIPGLNYLPDYVLEDEQHSLLQSIDDSPWMADLKRRVQHYGYRYDYRTRRIDETMFLGGLPGWIMSLAERLAVDGIFDKIPDQVIINEYLPGQGIAAHIDCEPCFGEVIASITLGSACVMCFTHDEQDKAVEIWLESGSLATMKDEARYQWKHAIPARKTDNVNGRKFARGRRVSITFRHVIL